MIKQTNKLLGVTLASLLFVTTIPNSTSAQDMNFEDVKESSSHYESIQYLVDHGVVLPNSEKKYYPNEDIQRSTTAAMFQRGLDLSIPNNADTIINDYKDIETTHNYADEIAANYEADIFRGYKGYFNDTPLRREQMATVLVRAFDLKDTGEETEIYLDNVSSSHQENVKLLAQHGLTNQLDDFRPKENVTRAQFATFLYRTFKLTEDETNTNEEDNKETEVDHNDGQTNTDDSDKDTSVDESAGDKETNDSIETDVSEITREVMQVKEDNMDLFAEDKPIHKIAFDVNPISHKVLTKWIDVVRETDLKLYPAGEAYTSGLFLKSDGYVNPTDRIDSEFIFNGSGENEGNFRYDFRSDDAHYLAKEWLVRAFPELSSLTSKMDQKIKEAREAEQNGEHLDQIELLNLNSYEVQIGVNPFFEFMAVDIEYLGE